MRIITALVVATLAALQMAAADRDTVISLVTFYPGADIYELEGHTALRITTPTNDVAVSYGMFDFEAPNFVYRFVKGETDYWVGALPWYVMEQAYRSQGRRIVADELDLDATQRQRLFDLLAVNLQPQNSVYRYNYVRDNCATRPLRTVELATGDTLLLGHPTDAQLEAAGTFRQAMRHYHANYPWYQLGIDLALGAGLDAPITNRDKAFSPEALAQMLPAATVAGRPLVRQRIVLNDADSEAAVLAPTPWLWRPLTVFWAVFIFVAIICIYDWRCQRVTRWVDSLLFGAFGLAGCLLTFLIFVSTHEATSPNWLYLWLNPLCLIASIGVWLKSARRLVVCYQIANFAAVMTMVVAWPWLGQSGNAAFVPLIAADLLLSARYVAIVAPKLKGKSR